MLFIQGVELRAGEGCFACRNKAFATVFNYPWLCVLRLTYVRVSEKFSCPAFHEYIRSRSVNTCPC